MVKKDLKILGLLASGVVIILLTTYFAMANHEDIMVETRIVLNDRDDEAEEVVKEEETLPDEEEVVEVVEPEPLNVDSVTGLLIGIDASSGNTDVLMVGHFDADQNKFKIVSVPRDLEIDWFEEPFKSMRKSFNDKVNSGEIDANLHQRSYSKVNAIYLDTGETKAGLYYTRDVVEEITGLEIDYIAFIDVYGFMDIVDIVGGVEFDVPQRMYYNDPYQDPPLHIDLQPGLQVLDGEQAMGLVRYRKYNMGDIQRIQVQQAFVAAMFNQIIEDSDVDQMMSVADSMYKKFEADFGFGLILDYIQYAVELDMTSLLDPDNMVTIPSWGELVQEEINGETVGRWHQYWDMDQAHEIVEELMNK